MLGDFNAHLGVLGEVRGRGTANTQGVLVSELMTRCNLISALCHLALLPLALSTPMSGVMSTLLLTMYLQALVL